MIILKTIYIKQIKYIVNIILISIFIFSLVFFPNDRLNIKAILFLILMCININDFLKGVNKKEFQIVCYMGILFPTITILISLMINKATAFNIISRGYSGIYFLLIFSLYYRKIPYQKILNSFLFLLCVLIVFSFLLDFLGIVNLYSNKLLLILNNDGSIKYGKNSNYIGLGYMIYPQACSLSVFLLPSLIKNKNYLVVVFVGFAMLLSGTRANIIMYLLSIIGIIFVSKAFGQQKKALILFVSLLFLLFILNDIISVLLNMLSMKSGGDLVRSLHFKSIVNEIKDNPGILLIGEGWATPFFTLASNSYVTDCELSYFDMLRQIGGIGLIAFLTFVLWPLESLFRNQKEYFVVYLAYLIIAYTNPLLYTSTAFAAYISVYLLFYKNELGDINGKK